MCVMIRNLLGRPGLPGISDDFEVFFLPQVELGVQLCVLLVLLRLWLLFARSLLKR